MTFPFVAFCHYSEQFPVSQAEQFSDGLCGQKQLNPPICLVLGHMDSLYQELKKPVPRVGHDKIILSKPLSESFHGFLFLVEFCSKV